MNFKVENFDILKTCSFTGHRSQKLPWRFDENDKRCLAMKTILKNHIEEAIQKGYNTFLSGMALGFDMICTEIVLSFKQKYKDVKMVGVLPCKNQDIKWPESQRVRYRALLEQLDYVRCENDYYTGPQCMIERNRFMIDNSSLLIALFNGLPGGTKSTIEYAKSKGKNIVIIKP